MSSLIAAVLGPGRRAQQWMHHRERAQQQQHSQGQPGGSSAAEEHAAQLDRVLGLGQGGRRAAAAAGSGALQLWPAVGHTSNSSVAGAKGGKAAAPAPWRPSSASTDKAVTERQQHERQVQLQQWQQWLQQQQQLHGDGDAGAGSRPGSAEPRPRSSSPDGRKPLPSVVCARCGLPESEVAGVGCCFHPAHIAAPGPLLYGEAWHACKASCRRGDPGCYTRREHFFMPSSRHQQQQRPAAAAAAGDGGRRLSRQAGATATPGAAVRGRSLSPVAGKASSKQQHRAAGSARSMPPSPRAAGTMTALAR